MHSHLTPEPRVDKNGVTSIRHVRADSTPKRSPGLPPPVVAAVGQPQSEHEKLSAAAASAILDNNRETIIGKHMLVEFHSNLKKLDDRTLKLIIEVVSDYEIAEQTAHLVMDYPESEIRDVLHYRDAFTFLSGYNWADEMVGRIIGIRWMPEFKDSGELSALPAERQRQVFAMLRVAYVIHSELGKRHPALAATAKWGVGAGYPLSVVDKNLVRLVMKYPERDHDLCKLIRERREADPEWLEHSLSTTSPLIEGVL